MSAKSLSNRAMRFVAVMVLSWSVGACGDDGQDLNQQAIAALESHYDQNALPRHWVVDDITTMEREKVLVDIVVESDTDVVQIKSKSRMLQFFIAKQGCPKPTGDALKFLDKNYRVWVRLWSNRKEELTQSICPRLYE